MIKKNIGTFLISVGLIIPLIVLYSVFFGTPKVEYQDLNNNNTWDPGEPIARIDTAKTLITIGGSVTEIVFQLGLGDMVLAVDQSSTLPPQVKNLPQVGYIRRISSEGILSMFPELILTTTDIGPDNVVSQIKDTGVEMEIYDAPKDIQDINDIITKISSLLNAESQGKTLKKHLNSTLEKINIFASKHKSDPSIAFFMNPSAGSYNAAGAGTIADYLITVMGGRNIFGLDFKKYQKVNKEQIIQYNPDIILVASHYPGQKTSEHFTSSKEFKSITAIENNNVIDITMSNLTMGPSFLDGIISIIDRINID